MAISKTIYCANESNQARLNCRVQPINCAAKYHLHLKGYVGGYDFDSDYVDCILPKYPDSEVNVLIDSLGGWGYSWTQWFPKGKRG